MPVITFFQRVESMDRLIRTRATGTPEQFAKRIGVSRRALFLWIEQLRDDFDFPVAYDDYAKTYYYTQPGEFVFGFKTKE